MNETELAPKCMRTDCQEMRGIQDHIVKHLEDIKEWYLFMLFEIYGDWEKDERIYYKKQRHEIDNALYYAKKLGWINPEQIKESK